MASSSEIRTPADRQHPGHSDFSILGLPCFRRRPRRDRSSGGAKSRPSRVSGRLQPIAKQRRRRHATRPRPKPSAATVSNYTALLQTMESHALLAQALDDVEQVCDRSPGLLFIAGMTCISASAKMRWRIGGQAPNVRGTVSPMMCRARY